MYLKNKFSLFGSLHQRIYMAAGGPSPGPTPAPPAPSPTPPPSPNPNNSGYTPFLNPQGRLRYGWWNLFPPIAGVNLGYEVGRALWTGGEKIPVSDIVTSVRNGIKKLGIGLGQRFGKVMYRGTVETAVAPISRVMGTTAVSAAHVLATTPGNIMSIPDALLDGGKGIIQGAFGKVLEIGGVLGIRPVAEAGAKLSAAGRLNRAHLANPFRDAWGAVKNVGNSIRENIISAFEGEASAWTGAIFNDGLGTTDAVRETAYTAANEPILPGIFDKEAHKKLINDFRPGRYRRKRGENPEQKKAA